MNVGLLEVIFVDSETNALILGSYDRWRRDNDWTRTWINGI